MDVSRDMVSTRHKKLGESMGGAQANQHFRFLRSLLNFCAGYYEDPTDGGPLIRNNPIDRINQTRQWFKVDRRRTHIKPKDFPKWFKTVNNLDNGLARGYLFLLLFCGLRKQEGLRLQKAHVNIEDRLCTVMDTKNLKPLQLPIPAYILPFLKARVRSDDQSRFIFPGIGESGHLVGCKRPVKKVIKASKVDFCLHDLRRFFITVAEGLDVSSYAVKALVNHSLGSDVTAGYIAPDVDRLRKPMEQIERKILQMAGVQVKSKIFKLKTG